MTRQEHIEQLAAEAGVGIIYEGFRYGQAANLLTNEIILAPWGTDVPETEQYWVALHELGHLRPDRPPIWGGRYGVGSVAEEAEAWAWALDHAAFPLDQAGESAIAWGITDYASNRGWEPTPALEQLVRALGPEPDWFMNVTTEEHWAKLDGWARPTWAAIVAAYAVTA